MSDFIKTMSKKSLEFHIKSDDYFGTLAAVLSLIRQNIINKKNSDIHVKTLTGIEKDLMILQKGYKIIKNIAVKRRVCKK